MAENKQVMPQVPISQLSLSFCILPYSRGPLLPPVFFGVGEFEYGGVEV